MRFRIRRRFHFWRGYRISETGTAANSRSAIEIFVNSILFHDTLEDSIFGAFLMSHSRRRYKSKIWQAPTDVAKIVRLFFSFYLMRIKWPKTCNSLNQTNISSSSGQNFISAIFAQTPCCQIPQHCFDFFFKTVARKWQFQGLILTAKERRHYPVILFVNFAVKSLTSLRSLATHSLRTNGARMWYFELKETIWEMLSNKISINDGMQGFLMRHSINNLNSTWWSSPRFGTSFLHLSMT